MTQPLWRTAHIDEAAAQAISDTYQIPLRVAKWLCVRAVNEESVDQWLHPESADWMSPDAFWDMEPAVDRVLRAIRNREVICVVGDYDVDGVTSSVIVASTLQALNAEWECLIPHRVHDGYGLTNALVDRAKACNAQLIITVDNGIRAEEAITYASSLGIDVILTDHHEPGDTLPSDVIANLHFARANGPEVQTLSGAGVARKFAEAILQRHPVESSKELLDWHTALAAMGALADVMPMLTENRKLVKSGLAVLRGCERAGWKALCNVASVQPETLSETTVLWSITPRLNAAGRMGTAMTAFRLLMSTSDEEAEALAEQIETWNQARKDDTEVVFQEALEQHMALDPQGASPMVIVSGVWNLGVAGIAAARLVSETGKSAVVLTDDGSGVLRGSGRAVDGFPLHEVISRCESHLVHFGGHEAAIGCAIEKSKLTAFREAVCEAASHYTAVLETSGEEPIADDYIPLSDATLDLVNWVDTFAPYGPNNPPLTFYVGPVSLLQVTPLSGGKHVRLRVREGKQETEMIWFRAPDEVQRWRKGATLSAVVALEKNEWRGKASVQFRVLDAFLLQKPLLREEIGYLYRLLHARRKLSLQEAVSSFPERTSEEAQVVFDTFVELGFAEQRESAYHVLEQVVPRDLRDSKHYQRHLRQSARAQSLR